MKLLSKCFDYNALLTYLHLHFHLSLFIAFYSLQMTPTVSSVARIQNEKLTNTYSSPKTTNTASFQLYGSFHRTAYWFVDIYLGHPTYQRQSLILDTGSSVTAVPCTTCSDQCGSHIDPSYNVSKSRTYDALKCTSDCAYCAKSYDSEVKVFQNTAVAQNANNPNAKCAYNVLYSEGSNLAGQFGNDTAILQRRNISSKGYIEAPTLDQREFIPFCLGCNSLETYLFFMQEASGIMGMEPVNDFGAEPFVISILNYLERRDSTNQDQAAASETESQSNATSSTSFPIKTAVKNKNPTEKVFAVCLSRSGGILTFGGYHDELHVNGPPTLNDERNPSKVDIQENNQPRRNQKEMTNHSSEASFFQSFGLTSSFRAMFQKGTDIKVLLTLDDPPKNSVHLPIQEGHRVLLHSEPAPLNEDVPHYPDHHPQNENRDAPPLHRSLLTLQYTDKDKITNALKLGMHQQNSANSMDLSCFMNDKPLHLYTHTERNTTNSNDTLHGVPNLYLVPILAVRDTIYRCLRTRREKKNFQNFQWNTMNTVGATSTEYPMTNSIGLLKKYFSDTKTLPVPSEDTQNTLPSELYHSVPPEPLLTSTYVNFPSTVYEPRGRKDVSLVPTEGFQYGVNTKNAPSGEAVAYTWDDRAQSTSTHPFPYDKPYKQGFYYTSFPGVGPTRQRRPPNSIQHDAMTRNRFPPSSTLSIPLYMPFTPNESDSTDSAAKTNHVALSDALNTEPQNKKNGKVNQVSSRFRARDSSSEYSFDSMEADTRNSTSDKFQSTGASQTQLPVTENGMTSAFLDHVSTSVFTEDASIFHTPGLQEHDEATSEPYLSEKEHTPYTSSLNFLTQFPFSEELLKETGTKKTGGLVTNTRQSVQSANKTMDIDDLNCATNKGHISGACEQLKFVRKPWSIWNVPGEDIVNLVNLSTRNRDTLLDKSHTMVNTTGEGTRNWYIPYLEPGIQWTPFLSFNEKHENNSIIRRESYYVMLTNWTMKGLPAEPDYTILLPPVNYPTEEGIYPNPVVHNLPGLISIVDSGTTISTFPLLVYTSLWVGIIRHLMKAKQILGRQPFRSPTRNSRFLGDTSELPLPLRVQGISLKHIQRRLQTYIRTLELHREGRANNHTYSRERTGIEKKTYDSNNFFKTQSNINASTSSAKKIYLESYLNQAKGLLGAVDELRDTIETHLLNDEGYKVDLVHPDLKNNRLNTEQAPYRELHANGTASTSVEYPNYVASSNESEIRGSHSSKKTQKLQNLIETTDLGSLLQPHVKLEKTRNTTTHTRNLYPQGVKDVDQECWYLTNGEEDLQYFAEMELTFLRGGKYIWRPQSFLYKGDDTNIYCLTLGMNDATKDLEGGSVKREKRLHRRRVQSRARDIVNASSFSLHRLLVTGDEASDDPDMFLGEGIEESGFFGSSFFLNHDLIFHIGDWSLGMTEAQCPITNLNSRLNADA